MTETPDRGRGGRIEPVELQTAMQRAYIDYAMAVIVGRALPDVRDGLKPVHRRVLYAMYDGGYRPDRGFSKCSRVVGDVMGQYHPHGDTAIYDTLVRLAQPWVMRAPLIHGQGNFGSPGNDSAAAMRYTECRMAPLAMEMVRDIERGHRRLPAQLRRPLPGADGPAGALSPTCWSTARPASRSAWPPTSRRTTCARSPTGAQWALEHPDATREELQDALIERIKGPDFPNGALIVGTPGHRAGLPHRPRLGHPARGHRDRRGQPRAAPAWSITELPYMVNPDNLALKIAELADSGKVQGIADVRDDSSGRTGQRLVIVLKRDAVARVVLNNLLKHTELQTNFSANMLALVDGVPRTLTHRPVHQQLGRPPDRGHPAAHPRSGSRKAERARPHPARPGQGARRARRGDRADPALARGRRRPRRADGAARDRRDPGQRDPRHAAAPAGRPGAAEDHRPAGRARARDRRPRGHPRPTTPGSGRSSATSSPRSSTSTATTGVPRSSRPTATCRWRT